MIKKYKKKFDLFSILITVVVLTILAIGGMIFTHFIFSVGTDLRSEADDMVTDGGISSANADIATDFIVNDLPDYSDNYIFWFFVATFIGLLIAGLYLEFEPAVMILIFIFGMIAVLGAWIGSEINSEFASDAEFIGTSGAMSKTQLLMGNPYFPIFIFVALVAMIVIMYNKKRSGEYQ